MKPIFLLLVLAFYTSTAMGQLRGTYTINQQDSTADFNSIQDALYALQGQGARGEVTFSLAPGTYSGFTIDSIPDLADSASLTIQSANNDTSEVVISDGGPAVVVLMYAQGITLSGLTILAPRSNYCLQATRVNNCMLRNCHFKTPHHKGSTGDAVAVLVHNSFESTSKNTLSFADCQFSGTSGGFNITGDRGAISIDSCLVNTKGRYALYSSWVGGLDISHSTWRGEFSMGHSNTGSFTHNVVNGDGDFAFKHISNSKFLKKGVYEFNGTQIHHNEVWGDVRLDRGGSIDSNWFGGRLSASHVGPQVLSFTQNTIKDRLSTSFCPNVIVSGNKLSGVSISRANCTFTNNLCNGKATFSFSNGRIYHNNFSGFVSISDRGFRVSANIFLGYVGISRNIAYCAYNNYYPGYSSVDQHPFHYDPQFKNDSELVAQNPMLLGKGKPGLVDHDINGDVRDSLPSIGAHEVCIKDFSSLSPLEISCGEEIHLRKCDMQTGEEWVTKHPNMAYGKAPIIETRKDQTFYFVDRQGQVVDSVLVKVGGFADMALSDTTLGCNENAHIAGRFHPKAQYTWSPGSGLSDSTIRNPIASPEVTTQYVKTVMIAGCATYVDTILIRRVNDPVAIAALKRTHYAVHFNNHSMCTDSVFWEFDDGFTTYKDSFHRTKSADSFQFGQLLAFAGNAVDTYRFQYAFGIGLREPTQLPVGIYPNPTSGIVQLDNPNNLDLEVSIYTLQGQLLKRIEQPANRVFISNVPGVYLVFIRSRNGFVRQRVVVE